MLQNWIGSKVMVAKNFEKRMPPQSPKGEVFLHKDAKAERHEVFYKT